MSFDCLPKDLSNEFARSFDWEHDFDRKFLWLSIQYSYHR